MWRLLKIRKNFFFLVVFLYSLLVFFFFLCCKDNWRNCNLVRLYSSLTRKLFSYFSWGFSILNFLLKNEIPSKHSTHSTNENWKFKNEQRWTQKKVFSSFYSTFSWRFSCLTFAWVETSFNRIIIEMIKNTKISLQQFNIQKKERKKMKQEVNCKKNMLQKLDHLGFNQKSINIISKLSHFQLFLRVYFSSNIQKAYISLK